MRKDCLIIGVCGGSGSGKTTIVEELMHLMKDHKPALWSVDNYYKEIEEQEKDEFGQINFDLPTAIDADRFCQDLIRLKNGASLHIKKYQFNIRDRVEYIDIPASKIILTEGIFLFNIPEALALIDVKIFVELDLDIQLERRILRDVRERGYDEASIRHQWEHHVLPAYKKYIEMHKDDADVVFHNDGDKSHLIDKVDKYILAHPVVSEFCCSLSV